MRKFLAGIVKVPCGGGQCSYHMVKPCRDVSRKAMRLPELIMASPHYYLLMTICQWVPPLLRDTYSATTPRRPNNT